MVPRRHYLTRMNLRSCWTPTEALSNTRQVKDTLQFSLQDYTGVQAKFSYQLFSFVGGNDGVKEEMKAKLNELIVSVFRRRPVLNYYQVNTFILKGGLY